MFETKINSNFIFCHDEEINRINWFLKKTWNMFHDDFPKAE